MYDPITCPFIEKRISHIRKSTFTYPNDCHFDVKMTVFLPMCDNVSKKTEVCLAFLLTVYICRWLVMGACNHSVWWHFVVSTLPLNC